MKEYRDHYFLKAKRENYPARSVYKLKEIDGRFKIFKKGMRVLDLGAAPGVVGPEAHIHGVGTALHGGHQRIPPSGGREQLRHYL